jgi:hypothetical protein
MYDLIRNELGEIADKKQNIAWVNWDILMSKLYLPKKHNDGSK